MVKLRGREYYPIYFGATPKLLKTASELRSNMTRAEEALWSKIRKGKVDGFKFRRQHPIGLFIVDFFCYEAMLVIEVDGNVHNSPYQIERDIERTKILNDLRIKELRFSNDAVLNNTDIVLNEIITHLHKKK